MLSLKRLAFIAPPLRYVNSTRSRLSGSVVNWISNRQSSSVLNKKDGDDKQPVKSKQYEVKLFEPVPVLPVKQELIKRIPVEYHGVAPVNFNDDTQWFPVYRVPQINKLRIVIKFKVYLTAFSLCSSLFLASQIIMGNAQADIWSAAILSSITVGGLVFIGDYFRRLVVQIYASGDLKHVRFCRFSFFGSRKDMVLPVDCIVRLTETNRSIRAPILNIRFMMPEGELDHSYDNYEFYELGFRLPIALGGVLDPDRFQIVLGKILVHKPGA